MAIPRGLYVSLLTNNSMLRVLWPFQDEMFVSVYIFFVSLLFFFKKQIERPIPYNVGIDASFGDSTSALRLEGWGFNSSPQLVLFRLEKCS